MTQTSYPYYRTAQDCYISVSIGKKLIQKSVQFVPTTHENIVNMGFGDLLEGGSINDMVVSNNGDFSKDFHISAFTFSANSIKRITFDPNTSAEYFAFIIKRI